ncbi:MAG: aldo/keto reductase [Candidatus Omnitrophica bacterium]|nr:aldo/keto reductase [Candidatus Omnitrophota bacterium]
MDLMEKISRFTLGAAQLGLPYGISGRPLVDSPEDILRAAREAGIDTIDTAKAYGNSEEMIGRYLKKNAGWSPDIITKIKIEGASAAELVREVEMKLDDSLEKLGRKSIYGLMLHNYGALARHKRSLVDAMAQLKAARKVAKIGISVYGADELKISLGYDEFEIFQGPVNLFDRRITSSGSLKEIVRRKKSFFARSVFLQGLFFMDDEALAGKVPEARTYIGKLRGLSEKSGMSMAELAFSYTGSIEGITSLVLGVKSRKQLSDLVALSKAKPIARDLAGQIEKIFSDVPQDVYDPRRWPNAV